MAFTCRMTEDFKSSTLNDNLNLNNSQFEFYLYFVLLVKRFYIYKFLPMKDKDLP